MIKISHRGNIFGAIPSKENSPDYVLESIDLGFETEVDLRIIDGIPFLGHDFAQYKIDYSFLQNNSSKLWLHCKNLYALEFVLSSEIKYKSFWHQSDDYTITTNGFIWTYPGMPVTKKSILVHKEMPTKEILDFDMYGICSDYVGSISKNNTEDIL